MLNQTFTPQELLVIAHALDRLAFESTLAERQQIMPSVTADMSSAPITRMADRARAAA